MNININIQLMMLLGFFISAMVSALALPNYDTINTIDSYDVGTAISITDTHINHLDARSEVCPIRSDGQRRCGTCIDVFSEPDHKTQNNQINGKGFKNPYDFCSDARYCIVAQKEFGFEFIHSLMFRGNTTCVLSHTTDCNAMDLFVDEEMAEGGFLDAGGAIGGLFRSVECERPN
jgi:hypothetical protein